MQDNLNLKNVQDWWYLVNKLLNNKEISVENEKDWRNLIKNINEIKTYFEVMSYSIKIEENNGFAYLEEMEDMESESLSKKQKLSFWVTLFLCILREYMYKKETDIYANSCIITLDEIKSSLKDFLKEKYDNDEKKVITETQWILNKTIELWILKDVWNSQYKINKILKVKLSVQKMEEILSHLKENIQ